MAKRGGEIRERARGLARIIDEYSRRCLDFQDSKRERAMGWDDKVSGVWADDQAGSCWHHGDKGEPLTSPQPANSIPREHPTGGTASQVIIFIGGIGGGRRRCRRRQIIMYRPVGVGLSPYQIPPASPLLIRRWEVDSRVSNQSHQFPPSTKPCGAD